MADENPPTPTSDETPENTEKASDHQAHELSEAEQVLDNGVAAYAAGLADLASAVADAADAQEAPDQDVETAELKEKLLRALADVENTRRRAQREREDAAKYAITNFARDLLTVADNLHRALDSVADGSATEPSEGLKTLTEGIEMTEREIIGLFERHDIRRVEPEGEKFDPNFHQAMFEVPDTGKPAGTVVQVMQPGYVIGKRLLRPAMVGVAVAAPGDEDDDGNGAGKGTRVDTTV
jgi:molecular chaperone GrpE